MSTLTNLEASIEVGLGNLAEGLGKAIAEIEDLKARLRRAESLLAVAEVYCPCDRLDGRKTNGAGSEPAIGNRIRAFLDEAIGGTTDKTADKTSGD